MSKVVTFGEIMMRLNPEGYFRFVQADSFDVSYGGGEANVAISLSNFGVDAAFVTKVPEHEIGQCAVNTLRRFGVNTSFIARGGKRLGIYFSEKGAAQRPSKVIYDRAGSSICEAVPSDFNWDEIFEGASWFHFTGITPALSDNAAAICLEAVKKAKEHDVKVSCDLNFRKKLWSSEKANQVMSGLMPYVDVCIGNEEDAKTVFGIEAAHTNIEQGELDKEAYKEVAKKLADRFGFEKVAITLRESISASDNIWGAMMYDGKDYFFSKSYPVHIVDRVGGGDSFAGGLIYSLLNGKETKDALEFAVAASALKHSIEQDYNLVSVSEVETLKNGDGSGRVQR